MDRTAGAPAASQRAESPHGSPLRAGDVIVLAALWALVVLAVDPRGDFPLGDDWSYARTTRVFLDDGVFSPIGWTSMPLLTHVLWGSAFAAVLGFSFEALRFSTLLLGLAGSLALLVLLRDAGVDRGPALVAVATLVVNPVQLGLAHTYMTDVPFLAWSLLALASLSRALARDSIPALGLGALFATIAMLGRQLGLFVPLAFTVAVLAGKGLRRSTMARAAAVLLLVVLAPMGLHAWLEAREAVPALWSDQLLRVVRVLVDPGRLAFNLAKGLVRCLLYLGLFCAPVLMLGGVPRPLARRMRALSLVAAVAFTAAATFEMLRAGRWMPLGSETDSILTRFGIGPLTLRDTYILGLPHAEPLGPEFRWVVTVLSVVFGALLAARLVAVGASLVPDRSPTRLLVVAAVLVYFAPLAVHGFVDRYLLPLVALVSALVLLPAPGEAQRRGRLAPALSLLLLTAFFVFSTAAVHDYLSWNRARWAALDYLTKALRVPASEIDGGFEFNGWHLYSPGYKQREWRSWWWVRDDRYLVAMGEVPGYDAVREFSYPRRLAPGSGRILALVRHDERSSGR